MAMINKRRRAKSGTLSARLALFLLLGVLLVGVLGYAVIEGYTVQEALYMAVITISTVGFSEVKPLSAEGRLFTTFFIIINIGVFSYILAVFSYYIVQGEIFKTMQQDQITRKINRLRNHVIVCGYGRYGREITSHFTLHQIPFVVIDQRAETLEAIIDSSDPILYIQDDATHDEALQAAGITHARAIIAALPEDSDNLFIVLSARQLNPAIQIVSRVRMPKSQKKLKLAGANHVIMPEQIGGFYIATLIHKPSAVEFFTFITNERQSDIEFEEINYEDLPEHMRGKSIGELHLRRDTGGANIIGFHEKGGKYTVNPSPETILSPGTSFIVLCDKAQMQALYKLILKGE